MAQKKRPLKPRDYLTVGSHFGRFAKVTWLGVDSAAERDALWAAQYQHRVAVLATAALFYRKWTRDELAQRLGRERQYIWDRFRGRTPMTLCDIAALDRLLGVQIVIPGTGVHIPINMEVPPTDE